MSAQPRRRIEVEHIGDVTVIRFVDRKMVDEESIQALGQQLFRLVEEAGRRQLLVSFKDVDYLASAVLGKLITLHRKLQAAGGRLILCNIGREIHDVFEITRMDQFFTIGEDEAHGLARLAGRLEPPAPLSEASAAPQPPA